MSDVVIGTKTTASTGGAGSSLTFSHTVNAGHARGLKVSVGIRSEGINPQDVTGITYGGVPLVKLGAVQAVLGARTEIWLLLDPDVGTADVVITLQGSEDGIVAEAQNLTMLQQTYIVPVVTNFSSGADSISVNISSGSLLPQMVFAAFTSYKAPITAATPGAGQTEDTNLTEGSNIRFCTSHKASATSMSYTTTGTPVVTLLAVILLGYGTSREITFRTYVDWNNDGDFLDDYEEVTQDVLVISGPDRGRSDVADQFGAGSCSIELLNRTGRYSPYNTGSPLAGLLVPGRAMAVDVINEGVPYRQFYGYIGGFGEPRVAREPGKPVIRLDCYDAFEKLRRKKNVRTPLYENLRVDEILDLVCDLINWPATLRDFDEAEYVIPFFWADPQGEDALQVLQKAAKQELGSQFFTARDGKLTFRNRYARAAVAVHSTWTRVRAIDMGLREEDLYSAIEHRRSLYALEANTSSVYVLRPTGRQLNLGDNFLDVTFNAPAKAVITPTIDPDTATVVTTLAEALDDSETEVDLTSGKNLSDGQVIQVDFERMKINSKKSINVVKVTRAYDGTVAATHSNGASVSHVLMGINTDFEANSEEDGDGVDKTNNLSISQFQADAFTGKVGLRSTESAPIYLMFLNIRGQAVRETNENNLIRVEVNNALVEDAVLADDFLFNADEDAVKSYANLRAAIRELPQPRPLVALTPINQAEMISLLTAELGSRVHIEQTGGRYPSQLDDDFFIENIQWQFDSYRGQKPLRLADVQWKLFHHDLAEANLFRISEDVGYNAPTPDGNPQVGENTSTLVDNLTYSVTTGDGENRILLVWLFNTETAPDFTSVKWNGLDLTEYINYNPSPAPTNVERMGLFYLLDPDPNITADLVIQMSAIGRFGAVARCYQDVNQDDPFGNSATNNAISDDAVSGTIASDISELVIDAVMQRHSGGPLDVDGGQDEQQQESLFSGLRFGTSHEGGATSVTMGWHTTGGFSYHWGHVMVALMPVLTSNETTYTPIVSDVATIGGRVAHV